MSKTNGNAKNALAPRPLQGVRIADLTWLLASAGATTLLASLGAEVIRIEWPERLDFTRYSQNPRGGGPTPLGPGKTDVPYGMAKGRQPAPFANRGGVFNDRNPGKLGITLNLNRPEGRDLFRRLVALSDVVMEGFTASMMGRWGFDYAGLREINPAIIYVQMAGFGNTGPYRDYVSLGPVAQAMSGLGYLSGLPDAPPTMWNHSYLDRTPPFYAAQAVIAALYYRNRTGRGQYIDQAQYEPGLMVGGTSVLDYSANGRRGRRVGNRSPHVAAAPHGIYRCDGDDAWIAIAVTDEAEWQALIGVAGDLPWCRDPRFETREHRIEHQDALDAAIARWTVTRERYELMYRLQAASVPAGVVQSPQDKVEIDPQLKVRDFYVHLDHGEMGVWPFTRHHVAQMSATPPHPGGTTKRGAPCVGEDNQSVYEGLLGLSASEIAAYREQGVI